MSQAFRTSLLSKQGSKSLQIFVFCSAWKIWIFRKLGIKFENFEPCHKVLSGGSEEEILQMFQLEYNGLSPLEKLLVLERLDKGKNILGPGQSSTYSRQRSTSFVYTYISSL